MTLTLDRLRALKRQAGASDGPAPRPADVRGAGDAVAPWRSPLHVEAANANTVHTPAGMDGTLRPGARPEDGAPAGVQRARPTPADSLRRLLGVRGPAAPPRPPARKADRTLPGREIDEGLWLIESHVAHARPGAPLPLAFARREGDVDASRLLFFDTETTGLAGGTGTRAFMIGAADWHDGVLRVRQLFIASMAAERAMLREFARWLEPSTVLASYNGRSYDAPLLRTRYRLARLPDALQGLDHLDLLHPSRRRWRGRWENCRLATIEREALRILREDDLPGSQAPAAWLSYLRGGASTNLRRVAEHNRQDVATLAQLLIRLCDSAAE